MILNNLHCLQEYRAAFVTFTELKSTINYVSKNEKSRTFVIRHARKEFIVGDNSVVYLLPACIRSKAWLIFSIAIEWVANSSTMSFPARYSSTSFGTDSRLFQPPKAEPFHTRPVTSWNGRVDISCPAAATPMMTDVPQPLWHASKAAL